MDKNWSISGEVGAAWGGEMTPLENRGIDTGTLTHASFAGDSFVFHIRAGFPAPELDQYVSLFLDGARVFAGKVTLRPVSYSPGAQRGITVTVTGPLRAMSKNPATSMMPDSSGTISERAMVSFGEHVIPFPLAVTFSGNATSPGYTLYGDDGLPIGSHVNTHILRSGGYSYLTYNAIPTSAASAVWSGTGGTYSTGIIFPIRTLDRTVADLIGGAGAAGCGIAVGSVDTSFVVPPMTFSNASWLSAITDACKWTPDASSRVRYNVSGQPQMDVRRRANPANWVTLTIGKDNITGIELSPNPELLPELIVVNSATVGADGNVKWGQQISGDPAANRRQILTVSGPEKAAWLPGFVADSVTLTTISAVTSILSVINLKSSELAGCRAQLGSDYWTIMAGPASGLRYNGASGWTATTIPAVATWHIDGVLQTSFTSGLPTGMLANLVTAGNVPDWWVASGRAVQKVQLTIRVSVGAAYGAGDAMHNAFSAISSFTYDSGAAIYYFADVSIEVDAIDLACNGSTPYYRARDYDFVNPPTGLSDNLLAAQAWTPYSGSVTLGPQMPWQLWTGSSLCILDVPGGADLATAGAQIQSQSYDLYSGITTLTCGAAARNAYGSLLTTFRSGAQDNVIVPF